MREILAKHFGFEHFREGQEAVIERLIEGNSVLAVFPTGGGKSLCYQLPALLLDGLTLVVSPLIALMKDQVDALTRRGISAARLDSTLGAAEVAEVFRKLQKEELKLIYVAPERLSNETFRKRLKGLQIALLAIDEAHCISEWGHNFRPDYLKLAGLARALKIPRVLALTATATPKVSREIRKHFKIAASNHVQLSFHRSNLDLRVTPCAAGERKELLLDRLRSSQGAAIVYVTRQETAEEIATFLNRNGLAARAYHAGLPAEFRFDAQQAFMAGTTRIVVATIAFGMGIDKSDIRQVIHYNLPKSLENYTQEIGRAGRDGQPSVCELLACGDDLTVLENFIHADVPSSRALSNLLDRILRLGDAFDVSVYDLSITCDIRAVVVETVLAYLETDRVIEAGGTFYATYRARLLRTEEQILAGRPAAERKRVKALLDGGVMSRYQLTFTPTELVETLGMPREKIVKMLGDLEAAGDCTLKVSGVRKAFQLGKHAVEVKELGERMSAFFQARELADLARLKQVLDLSSCRSCLTGYLTKHFGEKLAESCGHCDRCRGIPARKVHRSVPHAISMDELEVIQGLSNEGHAGLATPRQLARFLCGMTSPATLRSRLTKHDAFGLLDRLPFEDVMAITKTV
ncbi:RecQ family ATP-dependent DNA helicase [Luteolibacter pohnpeiensis]|uniref:ATP-dependent DNA helicase RecQ n=1 Tax=Luteolibacter pohnpeiensis TaxID=454153 RepID=A0A934S2L6_9BACT|nr:ATP-dependent DNA helicase RecQ [Luteolibacter pohnpeiensis]MBK1881192.1 RecQ family ATP-dependent DNA helicase [Luteolibacter pohnpeiensis]